MDTKFSLLKQPRAPSASEKAVLKSSFPNIGDNVRILAEKTVAYNCLGWAINEVAFLGDTGYWTHDIIEGHAIDSVLQMNNFKECTKEESTLDVFFKNGRAEHVSKKYNGVWTSKLGESYMIEHGQDALNGGNFGSAVKHYKVFDSKTDPHNPHGTASSQPTPGSSHPPAVHMVVAQHNPGPVTDEEMATITNFAAEAADLPSVSGVPRLPIVRARAPAPRPTSHPAPAPAPTHPAPTHPAPVHPAPTPTHPAPTPTHPAPTPTHPAPTPTHPAPIPTHPAPTHPVPIHGPPPTTGNGAEFEKAYAAWKATWGQGALAFSSRADDFTESPQFAAVAKLGTQIIPLVVAKLRQPGNDFAVFLYQALETDPSHKAKKGPLASQKADILKLNAARTTRIQSKMATFAEHQATVLATTGFVADITTHSTFQDLVKEGEAAIPHILIQYKKDKKGLWGEMLRQIETIVAGGGTVQQQTAEFETWLQSLEAPVNGVAPAAPVNGVVNGTTETVANGQ